MSVRSRVSSMPTAWLAIVAMASLLGSGACSQPVEGAGADPGPTGSGTPTPASSSSAVAAVAEPTSAELPYAHTGRNDVQGNQLQARPLVYVPNQRAGTVQIIDPSTYQVIARRTVAASPEHVVPNHDGSRLYVNSDVGNALTPIDPTTGELMAPLRVDDPYNLYFTPDGAHALVMASRLHRIDVRNAATMALEHSLPVSCVGINHADVTTDLTRLVASCEFDGKLVVVDQAATTVQASIDLNGIPTPGATPPGRAHSMAGPQQRLVPGASAMPQDVRLTPDGKWFLVADMLRNGVWVVNATTMTYDHFVHTGMGAHGIYPSRDATKLYVSNRDEGSVTVLDAATLTSVATWTIPGGGSPDMGGVSVDGTQLWLSGRYHAKVYVFDTATGALTHQIPVDAGPHGLLVWPQPGRFSLGHTGNMR